MTTLFGLKVIITPDFPKMVLAPPLPWGDYITPECRIEIDAWLLSFFGTVNVIEDGKSWVSQTNQFISMNPRTYAGLMDHPDVKKEASYGNV